MIKIIELLLQNYYFLDIYIYIKKYIFIYDLYFHSKIFQYSKYNEFILFSISFNFWKDIFYNFIINFQYFSKYSIPMIQERTEKLKTLHENLIELIKIIQNQ